MKEAARKAAEGAEQGPTPLEATHMFEESVASDILEMSRMKHLVPLSSHKETHEDEEPKNLPKLPEIVELQPETRAEKPEDPPAPLGIPETQEGETEDLLNVT